MSSKFVIEWLSPNCFRGSSHSSLKKARAIAEAFKSEGRTYQIRNVQSGEVFNPLMESLLENRLKCPFLLQRVDYAKRQIGEFPA
jgi:phenylacetate-coenzyme A ligase PaaK-like adenylate-forming protein